MLVTISENSEESEAYQKTTFTIIKLKLVGSDNIINLLSFINLFLYKVKLLGKGWLGILSPKLTSQIPLSLSQVGEKT